MVEEGSGYSASGTVKFIEVNWRLGPQSANSRNQLPDLIEDSAGPFVPADRPTISDLTSRFQFYAGDA
jgi:phospholipase C